MGLIFSTNIVSKNELKITGIRKLFIFSSKMTHFFDLPHELKQLVASYQPPATKDDLDALYYIDPSGKALSFVLNTKDPDRIKDIVQLINLPESDGKSFTFKVKRASSLGYYPVIRHLHYKFQEMDTAFFPLTSDKLAGYAIDNKDIETALHIIRLYDNISSKTEEDTFKLAITLRRFNDADDIFTKHGSTLRLDQILDYLTDREDKEGTSFLISSEMVYKYQYSVEEFQEIFQKLRSKGWDDIVNLFEDKLKKKTYITN